MVSRIIIIGNFDNNHSSLALIAEVILYSEGFESSKNLAQKMTQMYKLCSEQLSQQDHYDFGMRAVKTVISAAGNLKRENPEMNEVRNQPLDNCNVNVTLNKFFFRQ